MAPGRTASILSFFNMAKDGVPVIPNFFADRPLSSI
jgi:hypothetical protein